MISYPYINHLPPIMVQRLIIIDVSSYGKCSIHERVGKKEEEAFETGNLQETGYRHNDVNASTRGLIVTRSSF